MKGKIFVIVFIVFVLAFPSTNVMAGASGHDEGIVRFDQTIGHVVYFSYGYGCSMRINKANYDNNDFSTLNAEGVWFWKIEEDVILEYYSPVSETWSYGTGHLTYNWHLDPENQVSYGVLHSKGYVEVDSELKYLECKFVVDETGETETSSIKLKK